ncbi:MAG: hypothetical protein J5842_00920, partial [Lachnospiraceae bacterium]|nr:hypothetical protein [Lachnospiraceae bacterium]
IEVLTGTASKKGVNVKKVYSMEVPEGSVLNGVITDGPSLVDAIKQFWGARHLPTKGIDLVVNSPQIKVRVPEIPLLSESKSLGYLKREYLERPEEQVLGFYRLSDDKKTKLSKVCTEIADAEFLNSYLQVFSEAGVQLSNVFSGVGSAINMFRSTGFASNESCVVLIRDGMTVTAIFFVHGHYYYSTTTRIFSNPGTIEYAGEIAKVINQIDQFSRSQKLEDPIATIYLAGMEPGDESLCSRAISDTLQNPVVVGTLMTIKGINVSSTGKAVDTMLYPIAGLMDRPGHYDILRSIKKEKSAEEIKKENFVKRFIPYIITALVMVIITVYLITLSRSRTKYLDALVDFNTNPENKFSAIEYDVAAEKLAILSQHYGGLKALEKNLNSYPVPVSQVLSVIRTDAAGVGEVEFTGYNGDTGELSFTTSFSDVVLLNEFISRLKSEDVFTKVDYKGYTETRTDDEGSWTAILSCILSEKAGRDVVPAITAIESSEDETQDEVQ